MRQYIEDNSKIIIVIKGRCQLEGDAYFAREKSNIKCKNLVIFSFKIGIINFHYQ